jgi:hypothetical protein
LANVLFADAAPEDIVVGEHVPQLAHLRGTAEGFGV